MPVFFYLDIQIICQRIYYIFSAAFNLFSKNLCKNMWKYSMQYTVQLAGKITELLAENHNFVDKVGK